MTTKSERTLLKTIKDLLYQLNEQEEQNKALLEVRDNALQIVEQERHRFRDQQEAWRQKLGATVNDDFQMLTTDSLITTRMEQLNRAEKELAGTRELMVDLPRMSDHLLELSTRVDILEARRRAALTPLRAALLEEGIDPLQVNRLERAVAMLSGDDFIQEEDDDAHDQDL